MFPLREVLPLVLGTIVQVAFDPLFWIVVALVALQYRRILAIKEQFFGQAARGIWTNTLRALVHGIGGGLAGSLLIVFLGLTLSGTGLKYLWPLAILLMLINARFLCFAYAGGILSLVYLITGWPQINIPQLLALVAVLHMVESFLILIGGHLGAVPVYFRHPQGRVVGGFTMQMFWPIPIAALIVVGLASAGEGVKMPDWWPLIKPPVEGEPENLMYALVPVVAGLGYGDLVLTRTPERKSRLSAVVLGAYSLILLLLAIYSQHVSWLVWLAAFFAPLGHELVIYVGKQVEFNRAPAYVPSSYGLVVLDVTPGTTAWEVGLRSGDIILSVNGLRVFSRENLEMALQLESWFVEVEFLHGPGLQYRREAISRGRLTSPFGVIPVPRGDEEEYVDLNSGGILSGLMARLGRRRL